VLNFDENYIFSKRIEFESGFQLKHLNLSDFKKKECPNSAKTHNHKVCPYFHGPKDMRREGSFFTPELCKFQDELAKRCGRGKDCQRAHNRVERLYHPEKYKTKFCITFPKRVKNCEYGDFCSFAHSVEDIKVRLIDEIPKNVEFYLYLFKTEWCPHN
jgi:hypothetical protein